MKLFAAYNMSNETTDARARLDVLLLGMSTGKRYRLFNVLQEAIVAELAGQALAEGTMLPVAPRMVGFLEVRSAASEG